MFNSVYGWSERHSMIYRAADSEWRAKSLGMNRQVMAWRLSAPARLLSLKLVEGKNWKALNYSHVMCAHRTGARA
jgi:hypothetical protein